LGAKRQAIKNVALERFLRQCRTAVGSLSTLSVPTALPRGLSAQLGWAAAILAVALMFLSAAIWNGFPLVFYDTGAYLVEGLKGAFLVERSPVYSLFLAGSGSAFSLWPVVVLQSLLTAYVLWEVARIELPRLSPGQFCLIGAVLTLFTGIAWYTGQVEPDCMTALVVLASYLLLFRTGQLGRRRALMVAIAGLATACHPSHLGLAAGLIGLGLLWKLLARHPSVPRVRLLPASVALLLALALTFAGNYALTRQIFLSRAGPVFLFARLMQDGIVKRLLHDSCTGPDTPYRLCAYQNRLATSANGWLWGNNPAFHALGGFQSSQAEDQRIIIDSVKRYPLLHLRMAVYDSVLQFFQFRTGDGIESQEWILKPQIGRLMPGQLRSYLSARQQKGQIRFQVLNMVHVTVGMLSLLALAVLLHRAFVRRRWEEGLFPALVLAALIGNAIICGTVSNVHDRYQSRLIWLPTLAALIGRIRDPKALQPDATHRKA
jgi:hypothetical protein